MNPLKAVMTWLVMVLTIACWSCEDQNSLTPDQKKLIGKWKLTTISGGFIGNGYKADWNQLEINSDLSYRRLQNDTLRQQGNYTFIEQEGILTVKFGNLYTAFETMPKEMAFEKDQLTLSDPCCDMFVYHFTKLRNK